MFSRLSYTFREMWASLRRNLTLTVAAIITSAVSLLLFGLTLLIQRGFDNQLTQWAGGVEMIVYVDNDATADADRRWSASALESTPDDHRRRRSCVPRRRRLAGRGAAAVRRRPDTLQLLNVDNIPSQFKVVPVERAEHRAAEAAWPTDSSDLPKVTDGRVPRRADRRAAAACRASSACDLLLITAHPAGRRRCC